MIEQVTITVDAEIACKHHRKLGDDIIRPAELTSAVLTYLIRYGYVQSCGDKGATLGIAGVRERRDDLVSGKVPAGGGARGDDVAVEYRLMVRTMVCNHFNWTQAKFDALKKAAGGIEAYKGPLWEYMADKLTKAGVKNVKDKKNKDALARKVDDESNRLMAIAKSEVAARKNRIETLQSEVDIDVSDFAA